VAPEECRVVLTVLRVVDVVLEGWARIGRSVVRDAALARDEGDRTVDDPAVPREQSELLPGGEPAAQVVGVQIDRVERRLAPK
jgi:hypothetical protein